MSEPLEFSAGYTVRLVAGYTTATGGMYVRLRVGLQIYEVELAADSPFVIELRSLIANCEQVN